MLIACIATAAPGGSPDDITVSAGETWTIPAGNVVDTSPGARMPSYINILNSGTINILGTLRTEGISEGASVYNYPVGTISIFSTGQFESLLMTNLHTITNEGTTYLNRYREESIVSGSPGAYVGEGGLWNYGTFNNSGTGILHSQGFLDNYGQLTNGASATFFGSTNENNSLGSYPYTSVFSNYGTFTNDGLTEMSSTSRLINGNRDAATLRNNGAFISRGELMNVVRGTIQNSGTLTSYGTFMNKFTVDNSGVITQRLGQLTNSAAALYNRVGATLNIESANFINEQGAVLRNYGAVNNVSGSGLATLINYSASTVENWSGATLTNADRVFNYGNIINDGEIHNSGTFFSSGSLTGRGTYTQTEGKTTLFGLVRQAAVYLDGGILSGGATINTQPLSPGGTIPPGVYVNGGTIAPGDPVTLTIDGDLHFNTGLLDIQVAGPRDFDRVIVTGSTQFKGGTIQFDFINGYVPRSGDLFEFLTAPALSFDANAVTLAYTGLAEGFEFQVNHRASGLEFLALNDGVPQVPEPSTLGLLGSVLGGLLLRRNRTRQLGPAACFTVRITDRRS